MTETFNEKDLENNFNIINTHTKEKKKKEIEPQPQKQLSCDIAEYYLINKVNKENAQKNDILFKNLAVYVFLLYGDSEESINKLKNAAKINKHNEGEILGWYKKAVEGVLKEYNCKELKNWQEDNALEPKISCNKCDKGAESTLGGYDFGYELQFSKFGYLFLETRSRGGKDYKTEIADFESIEKQQVIRINPFFRTNKVKLQWEFSIKNETIYAENEKSVKLALRTGKRPNYAELCREDEIAFYNVVNNLPLKEIKATNVYGFFNKNYHDYPEYHCYSIVQKKKGNNFEVENPLVAPSEEYLEFIKLTYEDEMVKDIIDKLNTQLARNKDEKLYHKIILSFAIGSILKLELIRVGVQVHPYLIILGAKEMGKTTACKILVTKLFNTIELSVEHFEGSKGARLKHINNDLFPMVVDELQDLRHWESIFNAAMSRGYLEIVKGTKDGGMETYYKYFNLIIPTNDFKSQSAAFRSRLIIFDYTHSDKTTKNEELLIFLEDHIKYLGKYIYDSLKNIDIKETTESIRKQHTGLSKRDTDKVVYIKIGEKILNQLGLLTDVTIDVKKLMNLEYERETTLKTDLRDIIRDILTVVYRDNAGNLYNYNDIMEIYKKTDGIDQLDLINMKNIFTFFQSHGIYFKQDFGCIFIGKNMLPTINKELLKRKYGKTYSTLNSLAEDLDVLSTFGVKNIAKYIGQDDLGKKVIKHSTVFGIHVDISD